jgi:glutamate racemase
MSATIPPVVVSRPVVVVINPSVPAPAIAVGDQAAIGVIAKPATARVVKDLRESCARGVDMEGSE